MPNAKCKMQNAKLIMNVELFIFNSALFFELCIHFAFCILNFALK